MEGIHIGGSDVKLFLPIRKMYLADGEWVSNLLSYV